MRLRGGGSLGHGRLIGRRLVGIELFQDVTEGVAVRQLFRRAERQHGDCNCIRKTSVSVGVARASLEGFVHHIYRAEKKSWYVVARNFFLLLLNFSAWPCLCAA